MEVYKAISAVTKAMAAEGIAKDRKNQQQGYAFRGIDDVYNALSDKLAENGLCILPRVLSRECVERLNSKGNPLFYVIVECEFDFVAAADGSKHVIKTYGEAMDSGDKATNKAMSAAYKYACMQAFCIPTEGDNDADATTHDVRPTDAAAHVKKENGKYTGLTGPDTKTELQKKLKNIVHDLEGIADIDELNGFLKDNEKTIKQVEADFPGWWDKELTATNEFEGLKQRIERTRRRLSDDPFNDNLPTLAAG